MGISSNVQRYFMLNVGNGNVSSYAPRDLELFLYFLYTFLMLAFKIVPFNCTITVQWRNVRNIYVFTDIAASPFFGHYLPV